MVKNPLPKKGYKRPGFNPWAGKIPWRRAGQLTPVFLPSKFHGERSLAGHSPCSCKELNTTEVTEHTHVATKTVAYHISKPRSSSMSLLFLPSPCCFPYSRQVHLLMLEWG